MLELVVLLFDVLLPTTTAVFLDHHQELTGTFLMEVRLTALILYHTTEVGLMLDLIILEE